MDLPCSGNFDGLLRPLVPSNIETLEVIVSHNLAPAAEVTPMPTLHVLEAVGQVDHHDA